MNNLKTNARITGALFVLATAAGVTAASLGAWMTEPHSFTLMAGQETQVLISALLILVMALSCAGIGISMYPVLRRYSPGLAVGVAGFRLMEGTLQVGSAVALVALLAVSRELVGPSGPGVPTLVAVGSVLKATHDWFGNGAFLFPFAIGASMYYGVFFAVRLVPRWLSAWGFLGLGLMVVAALLAMFGVVGPMSPVEVGLSVPIALQEMVLAGWLIVKGYRTEGPEGR